jgi:hypothetical protein
MGGHGFAIHVLESLVLDGGATVFENGLEKGALGKFSSLCVTEISPMHSKFENIYQGQDMANK